VWLLRITMGMRESIFNHQIVNNKWIC
jgi:hypothetical protein